jgi:ParB family chromosome partitioning protein
MGKLDELRRIGKQNAVESMGVFVGDGVIPGVSPAGPSPVPRALQGVSRVKNVAAIPVAMIDRDPAQPREEFDEESLGRLAESLRTRGQLQPIRVRWDEGRGIYLILCGERRWRAARVAGMATVQAVIVEGEIAPEELLAIQLVENCLRDDLKPVEQARAFRTLMERNGWSTRQLARELAIAQPQVVRTLALLDLPETVRERVEQGALAPATAYEIGKLESPAEQRDLADRVVSEGLTRQEAATAVRDRKQGGDTRGITPGRGRSGAGTFEYKVSARVTVTVRYRGDDPLSVAQAIRAALKQVQAQESDPRVARPA